MKKKSSDSEETSPRDRLVSTRRRRLINARSGVDGNWWLSAKSSVSLHVYSRARARVCVFVCARHKAEERRGKCFYREGQL